MTKPAPEVSVIFLAYQQEAFVGPAVRSILAQEDVALEIILSDDASTDRTYDVMAAEAARYTGPHTVTVRRNASNQGIDHIVQLVELATCDVLVMAHGDDLSEPQRCRRLHDALLTSGAYVASSNYYEIDEVGRVLGLGQPAGEARTLTAEDLAALGWRPWLFGACLAWRRAVYSAFPRLDASYLPIGHDTLVPFRGAVLGGLVYLPEPLLRYRRHAGQWSHALHDHSAPEVWHESQYSAAMMPRVTMERDLRHLLEHAAPAERPRLEALHQFVVTRILLLNAEWVAVRQGLYRQGWRPTWIRRETYARRGRLNGLGVLRETLRTIYRRTRWQLFRR